MNLLSLDHTYHIAHILGTEFEDRMYDIYIGMSNHKRPPFIDDILVDSADMQAMIIMETDKDTLPFASLEEYEDYYRKVSNGDEMAKDFVLSHASHQRYMQSQSDVIRYLEQNRMCILHRTHRTTSRHHATLINPPVHNLW